MGFLLPFLVPCLIAGVRALDLAGSLIPVPSGSPLPLPSPPFSNPPPSNSSTSVLNFGTIPQLITCESATFNWTYSDSATPQLIISIVTKRDVSSSSGTTATPIVNRVISSTVNPKLDTYTWTAVDVPQGWYKLYATIPARSFNTTSANFFVKTGSDVSCLLSSSSSSSTSSSSGPSTNVGAIVGGVLGGIALLVSAAIIFLLYRRRRLVKPESRNVYPADNSKRGRGGNSQFFSTRPTKSWDNLGSVDSHVGAAAAVKDSYSSQRLRYQLRHPISQTSFTDSVNLPVLEYGRNLSQKSFNGDEKEKNPVSPRDSVLLSDGARSRRPSDTSSLAASTALSYVTGPPTIPEVGPPAYRSSSPTQTVPEAANALDLAPQQPKPHRSRKATRKPVPTYDPTTEPFSSSPPQLPSLDVASPLQITDDPFARPLPAALINKDSTTSLDIFGEFNSAASSAQGHGHYMSRSRSTSSGKDRGLSHKGSFGFEGRPMHYLIPDMPLPRK